MPKAHNKICSQESILEAIDSVFTQVKKKNTGAGLLYISIDNLPMLISSDGGEYAEEVLDDLVGELSRHINKNEYAMRTDKNHINIILIDANVTELLQKSSEIHTIIQNYGCTNSIKPIQLTSTIGIVDFPGSANSPEDVINKAYIALNDAKESFKHYLLYENAESHKIESRNQMILASYIQDAFLNKRLSLAYQPIIESKSGKTKYYECLLRIINENGTVSSAGPFIPIAEKMGFIDVIDAMVFKMAVQDLIKSPKLSLSVNLSNASIHNSDWLDMAVYMLKETGVAKRIIIEITETSEQHDIKKVMNLINTLQELGCQIALDDFGTGYTSFTQLKSLPVNIIKIDGSFVRDIAYNPENKFFVQTLLEFSRNFKLKTVAEFVETEEIANILKEMKVDYMQGNYFSPAVTTKEWI